MVRPMSENAQTYVSAVVLAGGQSQRFGKEKSLLLVDQQPLLARTVQTLASLSDDIIVVTNEPARYEALDLPVRFVPDERRGVGSLMGIYSGLKAARRPQALTVACDMPLLNLDLLRYMLGLVEGYDVVIPRMGDLLEPLHAIYGRACLPAMARLLEQGRRQIVAFFPEVRVRYVQEDEIDRFDALHLSFFNVNTPQDWERVQHLLQER